MIDGVETVLRKIANGLYMPGKPNVGMNYYKEIAPGVGQDRADVVSVSETVITPAGKFENCVRTIETSPIEKTLKDHKWYAPGVGTRGWSAIGR